MKKLFQKSLALVLSVALTLTAFPIVTSASDNTQQLSNHTHISKNTTPEIITEIPSKRQSNEKVFLLSDGSYMSAMYPQQVHYNENGFWENIDNSFDDSSDENGEAVVENTKNSFKTKFSKKAKEKNLVTIKRDTYQLNWGLNGSNKVELQILDSSSNINSPTSLNNLTGTVFYENILNNTDLKYTVSSTYIKEDIILKSSDVPASFTFNYELKKLSYKANNDGNIQIFNPENSNETIFILEKPFMYDANGIFSNSVKMEIFETNKGIEITITPDLEWLNNEQRVFPVTIDPTIITEQSAAIIKDSTGVESPKTSQLESALELNNNDLYLKVGSFYGTTAYSLIYVPLPENISDSSRIIKANMNLYCYRAGISTCTTDLTITAHEIETDWEQNNITKNTILYYEDIPEYYFEALDFSILNDSSADVHNQLYSFDITAAAQRWATGESVNKGILLKGQDLPATEKYMRFYDSDNTVINSDPCFTYVYRDTKGIEDYWTYTTISAGRSGSAAVNNFNGNLIITQNITGIDGNRLPVSIAFMYDSSSRNSSEYNIGYGWRTNYNMQICTSTIPGYSYYLVDSDGTEHYFLGESTEIEWKDEDGLGYVLKKDSSVYSNGYLITDKSKNKNYFRNDGKLGKIEDTFGNQIIIAYTSDGKISTITDGAGRIYNFAYNSSNLIGSITNPANKTVTFNYTSTGNLEKIIYDDNKTTTFEYGSNGITKVLSPDGTYTTFLYNLVNNHLFTKSLEFYGSNSVLNTDFDFEYKHNSTIVTSNCDNTVHLTYQFDNFGKTTSVLNGRASTAQYYKYGAPGGNTGVENQLLSSSNIIQATSSLYNDENPANTSKWYIDPYSTDTVVTVDNTRGRNSAPSLKIQQTNEYGGESSAIYDLGVLEGGNDYTIKIHVNTNGVSLNTDYGIYSCLYYIDEYGERQYCIFSDPILETFNNDWLMLSLRWQLEEDTHLYISTGCYLNSLGEFWLDDIQVDINSNCDTFNYVTNSRFNNTGENWTYKTNNITMSNENLKFVAGLATIEGNLNETRSLSQITTCRGKTGDVICFGSWANTNYSIPTQITKNGAAGETTCRVRIELTGPSGDATFTDDSNILDFNYAIDGWQFLSGYVIAPIDFTSATIYLEYDYNGSWLWFKSPFIYKEQFGQSYVYDNNGNIVSAKDLAETQATFAYQDNNLSQMINPTGTRFCYAYDETTNALLYANSSDGQLFSFAYDAYGNVLTANITSSPNATELSSGSIYYIRNLTTGNAMKSFDYALVNGSYATQNNSIRWKLISTGETDVYYIQPSENSTCYLTVENGSTSNKARLVLSEINNSDSQKFKLSPNSDGSFNILTKVSGYTKAIDSRDLNNNESTELNKNMVQNDIDVTTGYQKWNFNLYSVNNAVETINSSSTYTADGNYINSLTDSLNNTVLYQYNSDGSLHTSTDAKNVLTEYSYYNSGELKSISSSNTTNTYTYENDRIKTIETSNGTVYNFNYDAFGRNKSIQLNRKNSTSEPRTLATYDYNSETYELGFTYGSANNISRINYGNGYSKNLYYNNEWGIIRSEGDLDYSYDSTGLLIQKLFNSEFNRTNYQYDFANRVINKVKFSDFDGSIINSLSYQYINGKNLLEKYRFSTPNYDLTTGFVYGNLNKGELADAVYGVKINDILRLGYTYDSFARKSTRTLYTGNTEITKTYGYKSTANNSTSYLVDTVSENGFTFSYQYDFNGNITGYSKTNNSTNQIVESYIYRYDDKNQLIFAGTNNTNGTEYIYDTNGNILTKKDLSTNTVINYGYNDSTWADLLTSYNGQTFTYDEIGNPLTYNNGTPMSFTWVNGRKLDSVTINENTYYYTYDDEGLRSSKSVGEIYTSYNILDGTIYGETRFDSVGVTEIYYFYDDNGNLFGFSCNGINYYYQFNLQGDVIGIYNDNGQLVVEYTYDAWGKVLSVTGSLADTIGQLNAIRYRGYYYDTETGLYYVSSRYYDPEIGRWINADALVDQSSVLGYNLFAYCRNNPVNMTDTTGNLPFFAITAAIGAVVGAVVGGVVAAKNGGNVWAGIGIGAAAGALIGTGAGMAAGAALAGSITATTGAVMAGGSTLVATVGTGGLGAGATYIANNLSQAANNLAPAAQTAASKMQEVATKGKAGEALSGLAKNTSHIPSLTGTASYRIPDGLDAGMRILSEVKNYSGTLSYTNQLKDFVMWSQANGYQMHLYTNATLTGPLQQVVDSGIIQLFPLG